MEVSEFVRNPAYTRGIEMANERRKRIVAETGIPGISLKTATVQKALDLAEYDYRQAGDFSEKL